MTSLLLFGFLIGMRHALEADHIAAAAALATRSASVRESIRIGTVWGVGHTLTLLLFGSVILIADTVVPEQLVSALECAVGFMLSLLGIDLLRRLYKERVHFHVHRHANGETPFHAHSPVGETIHNPDRDGHRRLKKFPFRALLVGLIHGMAGSAALILFTLQTADSISRGLLYIALFGCGSVIGMAMLSLVIAIPLRRSTAGLTWLNNLVQGTVGAATEAIGVKLIAEHIAVTIPCTVMSP